MSRIWLRQPDIRLINEQVHTDTIADRLGIEVTEVGDDFLRGTMPADSRTFQPYGVIHGGANVVLTETLGSVAGAHTVDRSLFQCYGQEVNATHIRAVSSGIVTGTARPIHLGTRSQVWDIRVENEEGNLTCISKLILAVVPIRK